MNSGISIYLHCLIFSLLPPGGVASVPAHHEHQLGPLRLEGTPRLVITAVKPQTRIRHVVVVKLLLLVLGCTLDVGRLWDRAGQFYRGDLTGAVNKTPLLGRAI